jgi:hypothetical protein
MIQRTMRPDDAKMMPRTDAPHRLSEIVEIWSRRQRGLETVEGDRLQQI